MKQIRLGIAGLGRAGSFMHMGELKGKEDKFRIAAVCDVRKDRREKWSKQYNCKAYADIKDMILDNELDIIDIATRSSDHFEHAKLALLAGRAVFLEKPMTRTYEEALELKRIAESTPGARLYIRHNRRFEANFEYIKGLMENKLLGDIFEIHINRAGFYYRDDWQAIREFGGGQLLNWGPHIIDQSLRFIDGEYSAMFSDLKQKVSLGDCEDHLTIIFKGKNSVLVKMTISGSMALELPDYAVYGTRGAAEITGRDIKLKYLEPGKNLTRPEPDPGDPVPSYDPKDFPPEPEEFVLRWVEETVKSPPEDLSMIWDHLYDAHVKGVPFPITLEESVAVMKVITEAMSS